MSALKQCEKALFFLLLFAIPLQARVLYSRGWSFNEYSSFALYGTDLLIAGLLICWIFVGKSGAFRNTRNEWAALGLFALLAALSLWHALDATVGAYRFLKLIEMLILFAYVRYRASAVLSFNAMLTAFVAGGLFQAFIGIAQFFLQSDLGLRLLGETILRPDMRGVAVFFDDAGERVMRAYGTTPHPNILAAYLLLSLGALYLFFERVRERIIPWLWHLCYAVILFGFFLTFSRTVILAWVFVSLGALVSIIRSDRLREWKGVGVATVLASAVFLIVLWGSVVGRLTIDPQDESIALRQYYNEQALGSHPAVNLGIGIGNFVPWLMDRNPGLPRHLLQPVHNMYLLIYAEMGLMGILAFLAWLLIMLKDFWTASKRELSGVLMLGMFLSLAFVALFDHFFWTLQQGMLIWWVMAGIIASYNKSANL